MEPSLAVSFLFKCSDEYDRTDLRRDGHLLLCIHVVRVRALGGASGPLDGACWATCVLLKCVHDVTG
jgi:hypothetical protein